jgi:hypothetical protein
MPVSAVAVPDVAAAPLWELLEWFDVIPGLRSGVSLADDDEEPVKSVGAVPLSGTPHAATRDVATAYVKRRDARIVTGRRVWGAQTLTSTACVPARIVGWP